MQCRDAQRKLSAAMDGALDPASARSLARHVAQCPECRELAADFSHVDQQVRSLPKLDPETDLSARLLERVHDVAGQGAHRVSDQPAGTRLLGWLATLIELLEPGKPTGSRTLDEFGDFPPFSLGSVYVQLLDPPG